MDPPRSTWSATSSYLSRVLPTCTLKIAPIAGIYRLGFVCALGGQKPEQRVALLHQDALELVRGLAVHVVGELLVGRSERKATLIRRSSSHSSWSTEPSHRSFQAWLRFLKTCSVTKPSLAFAFKS